MVVHRIVDNTRLEEMLADLKPEDRAHEIVIDEHGVERFRQNRLVRFLVDNCKYDLNHIWGLYGDGDFTDAEMREVYRLMGYSVGGFGEVFLEEGDAAE